VHATQPTDLKALEGIRVLHFLGSLFSTFSSKEETNKQTVLLR